MHKAILMSVVLMVGCTKAPEQYLKGAEKYAQDNCELVTSIRHTMSSTSLRTVKSGKMIYICHGENGGEQMEIEYMDIPSNYLRD